MSTCFQILTLACSLVGASYAIAQRPSFGRGDSEQRSDRGDRGRGDSGGRDSGGRGGFDPSGFLSRMDRDGDGNLGPDEQGGPIGSMLQRLESIDPQIKPGTSIPIERITKAFEQMRSGRSGSDRGDDSDSDRFSRDSRSSSGRGDDDNSSLLTPLVPGFGMDMPVALVPGFGPAAEMPLLPLVEEDRRQAREVLDRYDRNKDGHIDLEETKQGRFWGTPMDFDRNSDGKLSAEELTTRHAVRRTREQNERSDRNRDDKARDPDKEREPVKVDFNGRQSYRVYAAASPEGLPQFFSDRDLNSDGQISMSEYTSDWTESRVLEFYAWDQNKDGVIMTSEVQAGVNRGLVASDAPTGTAPKSAASSTGMTADSNATATGDQPSDKMIAYARKIIQRYDQNNDGILIPSEWAKMLISPEGADADGDGRITVMEYAGFWEAKRTKK